MAITISHHVLPEKIEMDECFHPNAKGCEVGNTSYVKCPDCGRQFQRSISRTIPHPTEEEPKDPMED